MFVKHAAENIFIERGVSEFRYILKNVLIVFICLGIVAFNGNDVVVFLWSLV